jgi:hypothetical protein
MCFLSSVEQAYLEQNVRFYPCKTLIGKQYSFQKQTQISQGKNVLDAPASNTDGFLLRDMCLLQLR